MACRPPSYKHGIPDFAFAAGARVFENYGAALQAGGQVPQQLAFSGKRSKTKYSVPEKAVELRPAVPCNLVLPLRALVCVSHILLVSSHRHIYRLAPY